MSKATHHVRVSEGPQLHALDSRITSRLFEAMSAHGWAALIAAGPDNFTYLTGTVLPFAAGFPDREAAAIMVSEDKGTVLCPPDWAVAVQDQAWKGEIRPYHEGMPSVTFAEALSQALSRYGLESARVGVDLDRLPVSTLWLLRERLPGVIWEDASPLLKRLRMVKTTAEIELLEAAARNAQLGLVSALNHLEACVDPLSFPMAEVAERIRVHVGEFGAAAAGHISALQGTETQLYWRPATGFVMPNQLLRLDVTNDWKGYWCVGGCTAVTGEGNEPLQRAYGQNISLKKAALAMLRPGVACSEVFRTVAARAARDSIPFWAEAGIGHGVGVSEREAPYLEPGDQTLLEPGMVLALDIYTFGPQQELIHSVDTFAITDQGSRLLSWYRNWDSLYEIYGTHARHG